MLKKDPVENALIDADALIGYASGCTGLEKCSEQALRKLSKDLVVFAKAAQKSLNQAVAFYEKRKILIAGPEGASTGIVTKHDPYLKPGQYYLCDDFGNPIFTVMMAPQYKRPKASPKK